MSTNCDQNDGMASSQPPGISIKLAAATTPDQSVPASPSYQTPAMRRNVSAGNLMLAAEAKEARVRVIYTGGTIGMMRNERHGSCTHLPQLSPALSNLSLLPTLACSAGAHTERPGPAHTQVSQYT